MKFEVKVPAIGESVTEATIGQWMKQTGERVAMDDVLCEIESEKASMEIPAERDGVLEVKIQEGETVPIGTVIAIIDENGVATMEPEETDHSVTQPSKSTESPVVAHSTSDKPISHVAEKIAAENNIDISHLEGTGPAGRITKSDVLNAVTTQKSSAPTGKMKIETNQITADETVSVSRGETRKKMSTLRKTIARHLVAAKNETAMLTTINELDMTQMIALRNEYKADFEKKHGVRLGFMSFFTRAACLALKEFPEVNAIIDGDDIVYHDYCDISIAVSSPKGLVVPVIRNAESKTMAQIEREINSLADKAREGKLTIDEMTGGTFTITNGGVFGSLISTPIINAPQSAVFGMHTIQERPIARNGEVVIRPMMYVALSYDHRIIDGKESVGFVMRMKQLLEDPRRILLDL